jgi:hypothetical protein
MKKNQPNQQETIYLKTNNCLTDEPCFICKDWFTPDVPLSFFWGNTYENPVCNACAEKQGYAIKDKKVKKLLLEIEAEAEQYVSKKKRG